MRDFLNNIRTDKQKLIAIAIAFAVVVYIDFSFVLKAQVKALADTKAKVAKMQADVLSVKRDMAVMQQNQSKDKALLQAKRIVSEGELLSLLGNISLVAKNNAVRITQINPQKSSRLPAKAGQQQSAFLPVFIKLDISCGYHNLGAFINGLENSEYAVSTEDIRITPDFAGPGQRVLLTLKTYVKI